jgi:hypothetical protein
VPHGARCVHSVPFNSINARKCGAKYMTDAYVCIIYVLQKSLDFARLVSPGQRH